MPRLGQHFLISLQKIKSIVNALSADSNDIVIEIGPGHGELTKHLINKVKKLIAIEKDPNLTDFLKNKFSSPSLEIIEGNALNLLPQLSYTLYPIPYTLVGNIPYYITGHLLRRLSELLHKPKTTVLTIQKEVGKRITSSPPNMNLLAACVQFWSNPKIIDLIPKSNFRPQPKVDSVVIQLETLKLSREMSEKTYYHTVKLLFKQPRKTILNNLRHLLTTEKMKKIKHLGISLQNRPQNLSIDQIITLAKILNSDP